jgi:hypothetical protein
MCFHVFSSHSNLTIEFLSETILLDKFGGSGITVDLLVRNDGPKNIGKILIAYPNNFMYLPHGKEKKIVQQGTIADLSWTFSKKDDPHNRYYVEEEWDWEYIENDENDEKLRISKPHIDSERPRPFTGKFEKEQQDRLRILPMRQGATWCLYIIKYTILEKAFPEELNTGESIWIRLNINSLLSAVYPPKKGKEYYCVLLMNSDSTMKYLVRMK